MGNIRDLFNFFIRFVLFVLALAWFVTWLNPAHAAEYKFRSRLDRFSVEVNKGVVRLNGKKVPSTAFLFVQPLFSAEFLSPCEGKLGKPDLTITRVIKDKTKKRLVYFDSKIASDGENCGNVTGEGLYRLPMHRKWFSEDKPITIGLKTNFSLLKDDQTIVEFRKTRGRWHNVDKQFITNWQYFFDFKSAMSNFPVDFRIHKAASDKSTAFQLKQGERVFTFSKVGTKTWAVEFPDSPWLVASGNFAVFETMELEKWRSRHSKNLAIVRDPSATLNKRIAALRKVSGNSSRDIRMTLREVLLTGGEASELRREIVLILRKSPTDANFLALVDALGTTHDQELLNQITKALRVRNPKGPIVQIGDDRGQVADKIDTWYAWRKNLKSEN